jgi:hypothetical protein
MGLFGFRTFIRVVLFGGFGINPLAGHQVLFISPSAEIDQFASL